jgi:hypothetical protein
MVLKVCLNLSHATPSPRIVDSSTASLDRLPWNFTPFNLTNTYGVLS